MKKRGQKTSGEVAVMAYWISYRKSGDIKEIYQSMSRAETEAFPNANLLLLAMFCRAGLPQVTSDLEGWLAIFHRAGLPQVTWDLGWGDCWPYSTEQGSPKSLRIWVGETAGHVLQSRSPLGHLGSRVRKLLAMFYRSGFPRSLGIRWGWGGLLRTSALLRVNTQTLSVLFQRPNLPLVQSMLAFRMTAQHCVQRDIYRRTYEEHSEGVKIWRKKGLGIIRPWTMKKVEMLSRKQ